VFPARLLGRRLPGGGAAECFLLERVDADTWVSLVSPGQKIHPGSRLMFADDARAPGVTLVAEIVERRAFGRRLVRLRVTGERDVDAAVDRLGHVPLPPYIRRDDRADDRDRYQTIYAAARGSVAAPTAGLHFTREILTSLQRAAIEWTTITLHVGYGTFKPVRVEQIEDHQVDAERYEISASAAAAIASTRVAGHRVIAIGTTTTRALESMAVSGGLRPGAGTTDLFIKPGHAFQAVDGLLTNFHLPRSSLLMLVTAFGGHDLVMAAYRHAVAERFHFYSYGDAMLVL
jgi:S-adenosylmethionine:tRNA ribosyltransferase-isomerase